MRLRRVSSIVGVVATAVLVAGLTAAPAAAWDPPGGSGIGWQYSEEGAGYYRPPQGGEESPQGPERIPTVLIEVSDQGETLECVDGPDRDCNGVSGTTCAPTDPDTGRPRFAMHRFTREIEDGEPQKWVLDREAEWCTVPEDDDWVPIEEVTEDVEYEVFQPLGDPEIKINPGDEAVVNLPTVVSTNYPEPLNGPGEIVSYDPLVLRIPVDIERPGQNLTGEILAEGEFTWTFEGGGAVTGRGKPYDPSIDPRDDGGYYVSNVFREPGTMTIDLDVMFTGEVTVEGLEPEPIEPVDDIGATTEIPVTELNNVLN